MQELRVCNKFTKAYESPEHMANNMYPHSNLSQFFKLKIGKNLPVLAGCCETTVGTVDGWVMVCDRTH